MHKAQERYCKDFHQKVLLPEERVRAVDHVFIRTKHVPSHEPNHKFTPVANGSSKVTAADDNSYSRVTDNLVTELVSIYHIVLSLRNEVKADELTSRSTTHN